MQLIRSQRGLMAQIARDLGIARSSVAVWREVPARYLTAVEASTGIPRHELRPDICLPPCRCPHKEPAA